MKEPHANLIADLRSPLESLDRSGEKWSQWSSPALIELSALDTYRFISSMISRPAQKILEIGCGNGYLSLELARDGHTVVGLDQSPEIIEVAERSKKASPLPPTFGELTYCCEDFATWLAPENTFDIVIFNRTLHHMHELQLTLTKVKRLLKKDGRLLCQDYAYDRLDEKTASWMYMMQRMLFLSHLADEDPATEESELQSIEAMRTAWLQGAERRLNRWGEMIQALQAIFSQRWMSWVPYLFVYIGNGICSAESEQERALITFLKHTEQMCIERGYIQAVGFRYVGGISPGEQ